MPGNTSRPSERRLKLSDLSDRPKPLFDPARPMDNEPLREVADGYTDLFGTALLAWLRENRDIVRRALDLD